MTRRRAAGADPLLTTLRRCRYLFLILATTTIFACGGGSSSDATSPPLDQDSTSMPTAATSSTLGNFPVTIAGTNDNAGLTVVRYELISSTRVSRTVFDYSYRVTVQVEGQSYPNGALLTVHSTAPSTTFPDPNVSTERLVAFSVAEPTDTFTLRQDRTIPLDGSSLIWQVTGESAAAPPRPLQVLLFDFVKESGREGHTALLPIKSPPAVGPHLVTLQLSIPVTAVSVALKRTTAATIAQSSLEPRTLGENPTVDWFGTVTVPPEEFSVEIIATPTEGVPQSFSLSRLFSPRTTDVIVKPSRISLLRNTSQTVTLELVNSALAGTSFDIAVPPQAPLYISPTEAALTLNSEGRGQLEITISANAVTEPKTLSLPITATSASHPEASTEVIVTVRLYPIDRP